MLLEKSIRDKTVTAKGFMLYSIDVKPSQVVSPMTPLAKVADVSKAILSVYVDEDELKGIKNKNIYLDGVKTSYKITRMLNIADTKSISKYKVQIVIAPPKVFSKLLKVEFK